MIHVAATDRVLIIGATGSGKSAFAGELARRWPRFMVHDPSHLERQLPGSVLAVGAAEAARALPGRVHYWPAPAEYGDLAAALEPVLGRIRATGGAQGIVLHELALVAPPWGAKPNLKYAIVGGRKHRMPMLMCTQRPRFLDPFARSQAGLLVVFRVDDLDDQVEVRRLLGLPRGASLELDPYGFWSRRLMPLVDDVDGHLIAPAEPQGRPHRPIELSA